MWKLKNCFTTHISTFLFLMSGDITCQFDIHKLKKKKFKIQCQNNIFISILCSYLSVCFDSHLSLLLRLQSSLFVERIRKWSMESLTERLLPLIAPSKPIPPRGFDLDGLSIPVPNWIPCHSHDIRSGDLPHKYVIWSKNSDPSLMIYIWWSSSECTKVPTIDFERFCTKIFINFYVISM